MKAAKDQILSEGTSALGAREIQRAVDKRIVAPLSKLVASGQIKEGDVIKIDFNGAWVYTNLGSSLPFIAELRSDPSTRVVADFLLPAAPPYPSFPSFDPP